MHAQDRCKIEKTEKKRQVEVLGWVGGGGARPPECELVHSPRRPRRNHAPPTPPSWTFGPGGGGLVVPRTLDDDC